MTAGQLPEQFERAPLRMPDIDVNIVSARQRRGGRATRNLYSIGKIYIVLALLYCRGLSACFLVKFGANDLNCVGVPLNPTHSLSDLLCY